MRFQLQTDYALKALLHLTAHRDSNCTTEEIAALYQISAAHLGRVIRRLQKHGYVKAIRGRRGGVRLDRDPERLVLGEVVEALEDGGVLFDLGEEPTAEAREESQRIRAVLRRARGQFLNYLYQATFAELVEQPQLITNAVTDVPVTVTAPVAPAPVAPAPVAPAPVPDPATV